MYTFFENFIKSEISKKGNGGWTQYQNRNMNGKQTFGTKYEHCSMGREWMPNLSTTQKYWVLGCSMEDIYLL